jgi:hypothetical protein
MLLGVYSSAQHCSVLAARGGLALEGTPARSSQLKGLDITISDHLSMAKQHHEQTSWKSFDRPFLRTSEQTLTIDLLFVRQVAV